MEQVKLLEFINMVSGTKMGSKKGIGYDDPRFALLEKIVTEEMAEVALSLRYRDHQTIEEISKGIFEMVVNNVENTRKYPQIAKAFDDYGILRNPIAAGNFPIGKGLMRVIPIQSAVDGNTHTAESEEISTYLENARAYSVSDCSCRTSREEMGEGCGHLKEDMCIQLDDAAEYYIRTGRGREISKEETYDIISRAEEDGLMHQVPNTEGEGHTHAICNCCGCSCYALRAASMYHNPDMIRSNYVSKVDKELCTGCGECKNRVP